jgi:hypothetical protein
MMVKFGKTFFYFKNDKLLSTQNQPILQRILRTLLTLFVGDSFSFFAFIV